jgi:hypothetical protein
MILRRTQPYDPLAITAFEVAPDAQTLADAGKLPDPTLYSSGPIALCRQCTKRTSPSALQMSAIGGKADIWFCIAHVR